MPAVEQRSKHSAAAQAIKQAAILWQPGKVAVAPTAAPTAAAPPKPAPGIMPHERRSLSLHRLVLNSNQAESLTGACGAALAVAKTG